MVDTSGIPGRGWTPPDPRARWALSIALSAICIHSSWLPGGSFLKTSRVMPPVLDLNKKSSCAGVRVAEPGPWGRGPLPGTAGAAGAAGCPGLGRAAIPGGMLRPLAASAPG